MLQKIVNLYDSIENFLDTLERFGLDNPAKCKSCDDYGCSDTLGGYINRVLKTDSINK